MTDGVYQAAIHALAVVPESQKKGIGTTFMTNLLARLSHCNVILYSSPGKEEFYKKLGLWKLKTGMALFKKAAAMAEKGITE